SVAQALAVVEVLRALVEHFAERPRDIRRGVEADPGSPEALRAAVSWIGGMTDRYAFDTAIRVLDWPIERLPKGIERTL
ncbi:MAG: deoxyguanosinetriphosphate triphosphohydrolase, partial [Propionibacteriaceae bacterium]|nr:deoxyguanosinetriphosphate triphosphohydrolase [Propionibacteriaceae bacterium]